LCMNVIGAERSDVHTIGPKIPTQVSHDYRYSFMIKQFKAYAQKNIYLYK